LRGTGVEIFGADAMDPDFGAIDGVDALQRFFDVLGRRERARRIARSELANRTSGAVGTSLSHEFNLEYKFELT
jgi:hypothetical protein